MTQREKFLAVADALAPLQGALTYSGGSERGSCDAHLRLDGDIYVCVEGGVISAKTAISLARALLVMAGVEESSSDPAS